MYIHVCVQLLSLMQDMDSFYHLSITFQVGFHIFKIFSNYICFLLPFMWHGHLIINCLEKYLLIHICLPPNTTGALTGWMWPTILKGIVISDTALSPASNTGHSTIELRGFSPKTYSDILNYTRNMLIGWPGLFVSGFREWTDVTIFYNLV